MFDARDLLGQLTQARMGGSTPDRLGHAMGPQGLGRSGSPIGDLLGGLLGGRAGAGGGLAGGLGGLLGGASGGGLGGGLGGLASQADSMLGGNTGAVLRDRNELAIGGLAALAGAVLGGSKGGAGGAVGGGLLALLGSLAYSAWKKGAAAPGSPTPDAVAPSTPATDPVRDVPLGLRPPHSTEEEAELQNTALLAIRAMINAAKADGAIDGGEMGKIMGKLKEFGSTDDARDFVMNELQKPFDLEGLVCDVRSTEQAIQVYGASLLAIEVDTTAEKSYLQQLADRLGLDAETVGHVQQTLGIPALS